MDPFTFTFLLGAMVVAVVVRTVPGVVSDAIATARAARAGEWGLIDKERTRRSQDRERRIARRERWARAWADRRQARREWLGERGPYRPGAKAYLGDVYHTYWERKLAEREAARVADGLGEPDDATLRDRLDQAVRDRVAGQRAARAERAGDAWHDDRLPVPGRPAAEDFPAPDDDEPPRRRVRPDSPQPGAGRADWDDYDDYDMCRDEPDGDQPAPTPTPTEPHTEPATPAGVPEGAPAMTATTTTTVEVLNNESLRQNAEEIIAGGAQLAEAVAMAEAAKARIAAAANASVDGVTAKSFDAGATAAVADVADQIGAGTLSEWAEIADNVRAGGEAIIDHLAGWLNEEDKIAQAGIDTSTLASTSS